MGYEEYNAMWCFLRMNIWVLLKHVNDQPDYGQAKPAFKNESVWCAFFERLLLVGNRVIMHDYLTSTTFKESYVKYRKRKTLDGDEIGNDQIISSLDERRFWSSAVIPL